MSIKPDDKGRENQGEEVQSSSENDEQNSHSSSLSGLAAYLTESPQNFDPRAARKQVTVLFCDVADYTSRSLNQDPEDLSHEIRTFQKVCGQIAENFQGHVSNYLGDGIMVLFGHPYASEFSPERAVRAGLEMVKAIKSNNESDEWKNRQPISIRVGIATGLVVVGERAGHLRDQDELIFGEAPNLAARLQDLASPNTVVASLTTRRLVGSVFKFRDLGSHKLKGFEQLISAWQIVEPRSYQPRPGSQLGRPSATFVSRQDELSHLSEKYQQAIYGFSRFVNVTGEPGIGKSRLVRVFERTIHTQNLYRVRLTCTPYFQTSPFRPIVDECMRWLQLGENDDLISKQTSINWALSVLKISDSRDQALFYELMSIPKPVHVADLKIDSEQKHRLTMRLLINILIKLSRVHPLLLVVEDMHWADASTIEVISRLVNNTRHGAIFGILIYRPEFIPPWEKNDSISHIELKGLSKLESEELIESIFGNQDLPQGIKQNLVNKGDGVPLFLEESSITAIHHIKTSGTGNPAKTGFDVPETLQDSLNARLDQLGEAKRFAQLAATFGGDFNYTTISQIADRNGIDADTGMDSLLESNLIQVIPDKNQDRYQFRHVMFQEAAYQSLLIKVRQVYHQQIADLYQQSEPDLVHNNPELLAYHYSKTNSLDLAVSLWLKAGENAIEKSAMVEALNHLHQGLTLITALPDSELKQRYELDLLLNLGVALTAKSGYYGKEVAQTYDRAANLADRFGTDEQQWTALYGCWRCEVTRAQYQNALKLLARLKTLSAKVDDKKLSMTAYGMRGITRMVAGRFDSAARFYTKAITMGDQKQEKALGVRFGQDPFVTIQGLSAVNLLVKDQVTDSMFHIAASVDSARQVGHPYTIAEALRTAAMYEQLSRNLPRLRKTATEARNLSEQYGFDGLLAAAKMFLSFSNVVVDRKQSDIESIKRNLSVYKQKFSLMFLPYFHGMLAEAYLLTDRVKESFETADSALRLINHYGEEWSKSMALWVKAEAAIRGDLADETAIKNWIRQSISIAEEQNATLFLRRILKTAISYETDIVTRSELQQQLQQITPDQFSSDLLDEYTLSEH